MWLKCIYVRDDTEQDRKWRIACPAEIMVRHCEAENSYHIHNLAETSRGFPLSSEEWSVVGLWVIGFLLGANSQAWVCDFGSLCSLARAEPWGWGKRKKNFKKMVVTSRTKWILAKILLCQCGAKTCHISEACEKPGVFWGQFGMHALMFLFKVMPVFSESQAESFPTDAPESTRCRFSCMLVRRGSVSCPQPYPINGKRPSFVKEKSNESCSLFGTECFGEEKKMT